MTAIEFLNQAHRLEQQIEYKLDRLKMLRSMTQRITASYDKDRVMSAKNNSATADAILRVIDAEAELNQQIVQMMDLEKEIESKINQLGNEEYRMILKKRHISFNTWAQIARDLGYTARWVRTLHTRAIEDLDRILEQK